MTARTRRAGWAAVAACTAVTTAWGASAQASSPSHQATKVQNQATRSRARWKSKTAGLDRSSQGRAPYFVQLQGAGAVEAEHAAPSKVLGARAAIQANAARAFAAARAADGHATRLYTTTNLVPGFAVNTTEAGVKALASRPDVVKVSRIIPKTATNANTANLVHALQTWKSAGDTGKGVKVGDHRHRPRLHPRRLRRPGHRPPRTPRRRRPTPQAGWRGALPALGKAKVIGGYDLVGDDYGPDPRSTVPPTSPTRTPTPTPSTATSTARMSPAPRRVRRQRQRHDLHRQLRQAGRRPADGHEDRPRHGAAGQALLPEGLRLRRLDRRGHRGSGPGHGPEPGRRLQRPLRHDQHVAGQ